DIEQTTLESFLWPESSPSPEAVDELRRKGILLDDSPAPHFFAELFDDFLHRRIANRRGPQKGVLVDVESGRVVVDGRLIQNLTRLEFRLLLLLYGRLNKVCDKYSIVEAVWGEDYVDEVYDAAIEKLVSRLRKKLEPDPANPRYLVTLRGRGYKLTG
ncbi:MAG: hypothetical protein DSY55_02160, partial [Clostridia bacterium]